jgi:predicted DNA-binding protein YlxM (UPF0122 family)
MEKIHTNVPNKDYQDKGNSRAQNELLRSRLDLLDGKDKFLMKLYLEDGYSIFQISRLISVSEASISRRIKKLEKQLLDGKYLDCLRNRNKFYKYQMAIAKDHFLTGLSIREISKKRKLSVYQVRETITQVKDILNVNVSM